MNFTNQQLPEDQDQPLNDEDIVAQFTITCDSNGSLSFYYNWERDKDGITGMASVLSTIGDRILPLGVINDMKSEASSPEEIEMVNNIETISSAISTIKNKERSEIDSGNDIVIDPSTATSLM